MSKRLVSHGNAGRQNKATSSGINTLRSAYRQAGSWNGRFKAYDKLRRIPNNNTNTFLARAALELSVTSTDKAAADDLLIEAIEYNLQTEADNHRPNDAVKAAMFRHNLPLMMSVHTERQTPDIEQIEKAHQELASGLVDIHGSIPQRDAQRELSRAEVKRITNYYGDASEALVLIALQRYATERAGDRTFTPLPSLLSEDIGGRRGATVMNRWDISVYDDNLDNPAHKVQVKWNILEQHRTSDKRYGNDISVVEIKNGLSLGNRPLRLGRLVTEAASHVMADPLPRDAEFFARRQDALLEQIGYEI